MYILYIKHKLTQIFNVGVSIIVNLLNVNFVIYVTTMNTKLKYYNRIIYKASS